MRATAPASSATAGTTPAAPLSGPSSTGSVEVGAAPVPVGVALVPFDAKLVDAGALVKVVAGAEVVCSADVESAVVGSAVVGSAVEDGASEVRPPSAPFWAAHSSSDIPSAQQTAVSVLSWAQKNPFWHEATAQSVPILAHQRFIKR